jgi:hypothetical protein
LVRISLERALCSREGRNELSLGELSLNIGRKVSRHVRRRYRFAASTTGSEKAERDGSKHRSFKFHFLNHLYSFESS